MFEMLLSRKTTETKQFYMIAGTIAACVINSSMGAPKDPVTPMDFVPGGNDSKTPDDLRKLSPDQQASYILGQLKDHKKLKQQAARRG